MTDKLNEALNKVETTYKDLVDIANNMTKDFFKDINSIIDKINENINSFSTDQIKDYMLRLQLKAFELSDIKEKSALKAELAAVLQKQAFAISFNGAEGSAAVKDKIAQIDVADSTVTEALYNLIASLFKTKLDQIHRLVDVLKSILMARLQETKFMNIGSAE